MKKALTLAFLTVFLYGCSDEPTVNGKFKGQVWADNWFSMYVGETLVVEDSVPITTERSFNAETFGFDADYPLVLNFILKDFKENDTGLEYIGEPNQQMGDGGFIAQITDNSNEKLLAASGSPWKCTVIHRAPTNKACEKDTAPEKTCLSEIGEEPAGWKASDYDVSGWQSATVYTEEAISPKEGYEEISWSSEAKLIWTSDLETDNTLLCKITVQSP